MQSLKLLLHLVSLVLAASLLLGCTDASTEVGATFTPVPPTNTATPTPTPIPPTPTNTPTPIPPTATSTPLSPVVGKWKAAIAFKIGDKVNMVNFSFTINEEGNQITNFGIVDLGLGQFTVGKTSAAIVDGKFAMNADTLVGTTKIGRTFEGTFMEPDKVEGTFVFDYSRLGVYEGEWVGAPEPEKEKGD